MHTHRLLRHTLFLLAASACAPGTEGAPARGTANATRASHALQGPGLFAPVTSAAGITPSAPREFVARTDDVLFTASDDAEGREVWRSDGTASGTVRLTRLLSGPGSLDPRLLTPSGTRVFFTLSRSETNAGREVAVLDGSASGAAVLTELGARTADIPEDRGLVPLGSGSAAFAVYEFGRGEPVLWVSDGTATGTRELALPSGDALFVSGALTPWSGRVLVTGGPNVDDHDVWLTDGTTAGTQRLLDLPDGDAPSHIDPLADRVLVFVSGASGNRLLSVGVKDAPPTQLAVLQGPVRSTWPLPGGFAFRPEWPPDTWRTDGTAEGTAPWLTHSPWDLYEPEFLAPNGSGALVLGGHWSVGRELWWWDGGALTSRLVHDFIPGPEDIRASYRAQVDDVTYLVVDDGLTGPELWRTDGTTAGTAQLQELGVGRSAGVWGPPVAAGSHVFLPVGAVEGGELWAASRATLAALAPPAITCGPDQIAEATSPEGAPVAFPAAHAESAGQPLQLTQSHASGERFPLGSTWVRAEAVDAAGVRVTCGTRVDVVDTTPPALKCPTLVDFHSEFPDAYPSVPYSVWGPLVEFSDTASAVTMTPGVNASLPGVYGATVPAFVSVRDAWGNTASCEFEVRIGDFVPPRLECPASVRLTAGGKGTASSPLVLSQVTVSDAFQTTVTPDEELTPGHWWLHVRAQDRAGNSASCTIDALVEATDAQVTPVPLGQDHPDSREEPGLATTGCTAGAGGLAPLLAALWLGPALRRRRRRAAGAARV